MSPEPCAVCNQIGEGWHFGAFVCRPCSAFYRRTIAESKSYKCRKNRNCVITKTLRNSCRACRMSKCVSVGMIPKPKQNSDSTLSSPTNVASSLADSSTLTSSQVFVSNPIQPLTIEDKFRNLKQLTVFMRNLFGAQRSLYITDHPEMSFMNIISKPIDVETAIKMDKNRQVLMYSTLAEGFPLVVSLSDPIRTKFLKEITLMIIILTRINLTIGSFPTDEGKLAFNVGYHIDLGNPETFFTGEATHLMNSQLSILTEIRQLISKCISLNADEIDLAFLIGITLVHKLKALAPDLEQVDSNRSALVNEYHSYLMSKHGPLDGPNRFANIFLFYTDLIDYIGKAKESITIFDLFGSKEFKDIREIYYTNDKELSM